MNNEQRLQIRAELAQRMGYSQRHTTHLLAAELAGDWLKPDGSFFDDAPPDPFTDAADNRALIAWLAADDARWGKFDDALLDAILDANQEQVSLISKQNEWLSTAQQWTRLKITAPLDTITLAAAKALGIGEAE